MAVTNCYNRLVIVELLTIIDFIPSTTFPGNGAGTILTLDPCIYEVNEVGAANGVITANGREFIVTFSGQCKDRVAAGDQKTCTITNTEEAPTMQVSGQGEGQNLCPPPATVPRPASITFSAQQFGSVTHGQFIIVVNFGGGTIANKTGTLNNIQINADGSFTMTGTELARDACNVIPFPGPTSVTISGRCGTGVPIQFTSAEGERATFTGNVACTTS